MNKLLLMMLCALTLSSCTKETTKEVFVVNPVNQQNVELIKRLTAQVSDLQTEIETTNGSNQELIGLVANLRDEVGLLQNNNENFQNEILDLKGQLEDLREAAALGVQDGQYKIEKRASLYNGERTLVFDQYYNPCVEPGIYTLTDHLSNYKLSTVSTGQHPGYSHFAKIMNGEVKSVGNFWTDEETGSCNSQNFQIQRAAHTIYTTSVYGINRILIKKYIKAFNRTDYYIAVLSNDINCNSFSTKEEANIFRTACNN